MFLIFVIAIVKGTILCAAFLFMEIERHAINFQEMKMLIGSLHYAKEKFFEIFFTSIYFSSIWLVFCWSFGSKLQQIQDVKVTKVLYLLCTILCCVCAGALFYDYWLPVGMTLVTATSQLMREEHQSNNVNQFFQNIKW